MLKYVKRNVTAVALLYTLRIHNFLVDDCRPNFIPLIVGGSYARVAEFPHMAALGYKKGRMIDFLCGGTLISKTFVLTAAHCIKTRWDLPVVVHLGSNRLYSDEAEAVGIKNIVIHPDFDPSSYYNDVALIELDTVLDFTDNLRPACLASAESKAQLPGATGLATGWGRQGFGKEAAIDLMKVPLKVIDNSECESHFINDIKKGKKIKDGIHAGMMCAAAYKEKIHDTCQGDSGGPLQTIKEGTECMMEIVGITSFGKACGAGIPSIYTRVSTYLEWIEEKVWP